MSQENLSFRPLSLFGRDNFAVYGPSLPHQGIYIKRYTLLAFPILTKKHDIPFFVSRMLFFGSGENQDESLLTAFEDFEMLQFPNTVL